MLLLNKCGQFHKSTTGSNFGPWMDQVIKHKLSFFHLTFSLLFILEKPLLVAFGIKFVLQNRLDKKHKKFLDLLL